MTLSIRTADRNAALDSLVASIGNAGVVKIYSGAVPANVGASLGGATLLVSLVAGTPFAAAASGGVATANAITSGTAVASGTGSFFRAENSGGTAIVQGLVGASGSGADLILNATLITLNASVAISSLTLTDGNP